ncbi:penicillin-binding protein 1B [Oleiagrimonas sp. MCCC 1A03011]|uniref:penicillin-binding protein 1B n=1 Tax=Oleiagrimonas sp. MCCC 1A03011 TaxID=1926883 RepID=UPI000DC51950|nr:penicillin-binding protein 1B [Oleiagrimonas sp. MCCC 1A03011]RAP58656.1 penicillin-binding protein 1B [Oleiagrimonas sp. MCCC 1A03011]
MTAFKRTRSFFRVTWPWLRVPFWLGLGVGIGFLLPYTLILNARVQARFNDLVFSVPTRVYARPLPLAVGEPMKPDALKLELTFAGYTHDKRGRVPGTWTGGGDHFVISSRGYAGPEGGELPQRLRVTLSGDTIRALTRVDNGRSVKLAHLDPARIATLYGAEQEERRIVQLKQVPGLLVAGLQAVEDRDFKHHFGIDLSAIARAMWANLRAGQVVQGGSTLTQQLVRNLFLTRNRNLVRKVNEALLSMLIEAHYSKGRILQAYINEVFLGQRGNQAVHGFAAASEFYFGRRLQTLRPQEIALLVGLVRGPSYYDPRRFPKRALTRRNLVLREFHTTGLISEAVMKHAQAQPLGVVAKPQLARDRFPAFMDLVRAQITTDFDEETLRKDGLSIFTTLDPAAQIYTEKAIERTLDGMGKRGDDLQAAAVVTDAHNGQVLAMVGGRDPGQPGFNRALDARRPVGSVIKPFVYLVALAQPRNWSLATPLQDEPVNLRQPNGKVWSPRNDDHVAHGEVPLVDALVNSWNLATVHLGMQVGVDKIRRFLESFGLSGVNPNPSLLLGAVDLSPAQVAHLYQYLASGGHALPLLAVRGVLNAHGKTIKRYEVRPGQGEYHAAVQLITYAMQQVAVRGTAHSITDSGLGWLHAAGKTGTSDKQRDSWFAGFTGDRLAVVWVGRDDNKRTGLWGSSGALKVWRELFRKLPTEPLQLDDGSQLQYAWINPQTGHQTDAQCDDARRLPFISGYAPTEHDGCFWQRVRDAFHHDDARNSSANGTP